MTKVQLVIFTEEPSCAEFLNHFLPKIAEKIFDIEFLQKQHFTVIPHQGKSDLMKSVPRKMFPNYQKLAGSKTLGSKLNPQDFYSASTSKSFKVFIGTVRSFIERNYKKI
jgi:hypothetical protein